MNKLSFPFDRHAFIEALLYPEDSSTSDSPFENEHECGCGGNCGCGKKESEE